MSKFNEVKNEALNLRSDARKALLIDLLRAEENHVANSMIPLEADHRAAMKKRRRRPSVRYRHGFCRRCRADRAPQ